jgi:GxxExxY protein
VSYRGVLVGTHRLDLFVADVIVVELKAVTEIGEAHFAVVRSHLRACDCRHALILNFAKPTLEVRRVSETSVPRSPSSRDRAVS